MALDKPSSAQAPPVSPASLPPCTAKPVSSMVFCSFNSMHLQKQWRATLSMPNGSRQWHARQLICMLEWTARHTSYGYAPQMQADCRQQGSYEKGSIAARCRFQALRCALVTRSGTRGSSSTPQPDESAASPCLPVPPCTYRARHDVKSKLNCTMQILQRSANSCDYADAHCLLFFCSGKLIR